MVRQIVGLGANAAFSEFLAEGKYSADQIQFINLVIDHLVHNGMMHPALSFESLFTDFHDLGVAGVLEDDAEKIIGVIEQINANVGLA
ncbi:hypothetical protein N9B20_01295 [Mariniblastus sp.]|nr:hypothetical protein [Mariniblastus sp.]